MHVIKRAERTWIERSIIVISCLPSYSARRRPNTTVNPCWTNTLRSLVKRAVVKDGWIWQCGACNSRITIRQDSFFTKSHLTLQQLVLVMYGWARDFPQRDIAHEAGLGAGFMTITEWCNICRGVCEQNLVDQSEPIGGLDEDDYVPKVVEIEESKFLHFKYLRGQWRPDHWVLSGVERGTGKCFLREVPDRSAATLAKIIQEYILPGTIVVSSGSATFANINEIGVYEHHINVYTQTVNAYKWMHKKRRLRKKFGTSDMFPSYLHQFMWRNKLKSSKLFPEFLICVAQQYPV